MNTEITQEKQDKLDYAYIEKLGKKSERQLTKILNTLDKEIIKITIEKEKIERKLNEKIKKKHFVKDVLMEKWRTPSEELLEAIKEIENGGGILCNSFDEFKREMAKD